MAATYSERVYRMVRRIPYGKVSTYGDVAAMLGAPRGARGVGHALGALPQGSDVPWWRVLNSSGAISLHGMGALIQRMNLEQEGIRFTGRGRVDLREFRWLPDEGASSDG